MPDDFWQDDAVQAALDSRHMGKVIRAYRHHPHHGRRGLSQDDIAAWAGIAQGQVSKIETGPACNRLDRLIFWAQLLDIPEEHLWFKLPEDERVPAQPHRTRPTGPGADLALAALAEISTSLGDTEVGEEFQLATAPGRFFPGVTIHARAYSATTDDRVLVAASNGCFPRQAGRGLVVGVDERLGLAYGMDIRRADQRLAKLPQGAGLLVPGAYRLDDFTLGLVWAIANLDEALLSDDAALAAHRSRLGTYEDMQTSLVQRDVAEDLSSISQLWLGSDFCARHILRNAEAFSGAPVFWTQERRGEDASAWLLFEHKIAYLRELADRYEGQRLARAFCVPDSAAADSPRRERVLFLLAASLMESFDIEVVLCPEPEYAAVDGFVLDEKRQAIVASWVGVDSLWHVDVTRSRPTVQEFVDASGYARAHSATAGADPHSRLQSLADYLWLDWRWFSRRCKELADYGSAGVFEPRSRLLSSAGVDQACQFVAGLHR
ncbi:MAG TPA: helix-turn-helix transcriptional regulator [Jiangellaceae bacterium]|nr:helix-turn-helix transcriptional regulator [Jiangellaceae bacterium]